jgi:hypothetical protein
MEYERVARAVLYRGISVMRDLRGLLVRRGRTAFPPSDVNIEPSNLCNADCIFCGYQFQERSHREMPIGLGQEIIHQAKRAGVTRIGLTPVVGEPLVHRRLEDLVRIAAAPPNPLRVGLTTNGILLTPNRYRSLVDAGVQSICVSMTYPDEAEYLRIYRNKGLRKLVANLDGILDVCKQHPCEMSLGIRTPRRRWRDHPLFVRARAAGWNVVKNEYFDDWSGRTNSFMEAEGFRTRPNRTKVLPCSILYSGPHFFSDGRATACGCRDLDGKSELALDPQALLSNMREVYSNGTVEELRQRFRRGETPSICISCRHYTPNYAGERLRDRLRQLAADMGLYKVRNGSFGHDNLRQ